MRNVQRRNVHLTLEALLELWPSHAWPPQRFDRPFSVGAVGGHGPIPYTISEYEPGRRVRFRFDPRIGLDGYHELRVTERGLEHDIAARTRGRGILAWPLVYRWMHEALMHDLFDNAERATTGRVARPSRHSVWVRLLRRLLMPAPRKVPLPDGATLARGTLDRVDLLDAWRGVRLPGASTDPAAWQQAMFGGSPAWVGALMRLRNRLPLLERLEPRTIFAPIAATDSEVLLGGDTRHFDLRISMYVQGDAVVCSTLTRPRTRNGRAYLAVIRRVHPLVVRSMLARTVRHAPRTV